MTDTFLTDPNLDLTSDYLMQIIGVTLLFLVVTGMFYVSLREAFKKRGN